MAGVSHSTYERIRQTYATPERVMNLLESHVKRDSKVDLTFTGMPHASEGWLVRLIVTVVVIVIIIVVVVAAHYAAPTLAPVGEAVEVDAAAYANAREAIGAGVVRTIRKMSMPNPGETSIPNLLNLGETSSSDSSYILEGAHWSEGSFFHD